MLNSRIGDRMQVLNLFGCLPLQKLNISESKSIENIKPHKHVCYCLSCRGVCAPVAKQKRILAG